jgi:hypothetical protein
MVVTDHPAMIPYLEKYSGQQMLTG